jgi:hypothetical protein
MKFILWLIFIKLEFLISPVNQLEYFHEFILFLLLILHEQFLIYLIQFIILNIFLQLPFLILFLSLKQSMQFLIKNHCLQNLIKIFIQLNSYKKIIISNKKIISNLEI